MNTASRIISLFSILEVLDLHEEGEELVKAFYMINIDLEKSLQRFMALSILVHANVMDWVTPQFAILLRQDLSVAGDDITGILLKEADKAKIKLTVTLDRICIVLDGLNQLSLLNVHCLHSETALFFL